MVRPFAVLLALLSPFAFAQKIVPLTDPEWAPASFEVMTSDDAMHYAFAWDGMMRIRPDGTRVDPQPLRLDGLQYIRGCAAGLGIIVCEEWRGGRDSVLAGVSRDGEVLWISERRPDRGTVVFDGSAFVRFTTRWSNAEATVTMTRFDASGAELLRREILRVPAAVHFAMARADDEIALVWSVAEATFPRRSVFGAFVDASGNVSQPVKVGFGMDGSQLSVASNGDDAIVAWDGFDGIFVSRFDRSRLTNGPIRVLEGQSLPDHPVAVLWDGRVYRIADQSREGVEIVNIGRGLEIVARSSFKPGSQAGRTWLSLTSDRVLVVNDFGRGIAIPAGEAAANDTPVHVVYAERSPDYRPDVVWCGDRYFVSWVHGRAGPTDEIRARFFDAQGSPLGQAFSVGTISFASDLGPRVAVATDTVIVVWGDSDGARARRFDLEGHAVDAEPFAVDATQVAGHDDEFVLARSWYPCSIEIKSVGARSPWSNEPFTKVAACSDKWDPYVNRLGKPSIAWNGNAYALVYAEEDWSSSVNAPVAIWRRPFLVHMDSAGKAATPVALTNWQRTWTYSSYSPALAAGAGRYAITWPTANGVEGSTYFERGERAGAGDGEGGAMIVFVDADGNAGRPLVGALIERPPQRRRPARK